MRVHRAAPGEWPLVRATRLRALADSPGAFGSTLAREEAFDEATWRTRVADGDWFLARAGDEVVGIAAAVPSADDPADRELVSVWVDPAHRGGPTATGLVESSCAWAAALGASTVSLRVTDANPRARRFYERLGFRPTGERRPLPRDPALAEERMRRALER
ncbi:GNAT family N-acetyltransferase [Kineococcus sp. T90]|nr:GNAT family N-acetyltransferase [Kineococcus indalonis]